MKNLIFVFILTISYSCKSKSDCDNVLMYLHEKQAKINIIEAELDQIYDSINNKPNTSKIFRLKQKWDVLLNLVKKEKEEYLHVYYHNKLGCPNTINLKE